ncbi:MAG: hypothetical protein ACJ8EY_00635 [Sphingomicrobium sp.]
MGGTAETWRGQCIQLFAELEQIIEGLLQELHAHPKIRKQVKTGQPVGAAFKHVRDLTGTKGPFASKGAAITSTLNHLALWFDWRAHLTHGVLSLWQGRNRNWLLTFAHRPTGDATVRVHAIAWEDAQIMKRVLQEQVPKLQDNARSLAASIKS